MKRSEAINVIDDILLKEEEIRGIWFKLDLSEDILSALEKAGMLPPLPSTPSTKTDKPEVFVFKNSWEAE